MVPLYWPLPGRPSWWLSSSCGTPLYFQALISLAYLKESFYSSRATPWNHRSIGGGRAGVAKGRDAVVLGLAHGDILAGPAEGKKHLEKT